MASSLLYSNGSTVRLLTNAGRSISGGTSGGRRRHRTVTNTIGKAWDAGSTNTNQLSPMLTRRMSTRLSEESSCSVSSSLSASLSCSSKSDKLNNWNASDFMVAAFLAAAGSVIMTPLYAPTAAKSESMAASAPEALSDTPFILPMRREKVQKTKKTTDVTGSIASTMAVLPGAAKEKTKVLNDPSGHQSAVGVGVDVESRQTPYTVSVRALRGGRLYMEDEYFVSDGGRFAAVFDGHGGNGVSGFLKKVLYPKVKNFLVEMEQKERDTEDGYRHSISSHVAAIRAAFDETDKEVLLDKDLDEQGSTAVAVVLHEGLDGEKTIISANLGDSRAILSRKGNALDLTRDHKPNEEKEKERILAMGEKIEWDAYCHVYRVRNLSLSRAIGDKFAKPAISGDVEIKRFPVSDKDEFVLLASDGLWDVMTSQEVVSFVHKRLSVASSQGNNSNKIKEMRIKNMSRYVANEALRRGSGDNICVVIVWLKQ